MKKDSMPGFGTEFKEIHFVIVIDSEGRFVRFEDLRDAKKKRGQQFNVRRAVVRASGVKANYLYDNGTYVLGLKDEGKASKRANAEAEKLQAFAGKIFAAAEALTDNTELKALAAFYRSYMSPDRDRTAMESDPLWDDVKAAA
ncbi:MAG: type I-C CRISPR-associated protein Cas8c/Csd1, partial [Muribaculaceae bacterium]|nr:type I-C CRISPR-associated protein Cas8c/Csd1 [Muribaculaceae bacterium]